VKTMEGTEGERERNRAHTAAAVDIAAGHFVDIHRRVDSCPVVAAYLHLVGPPGRNMHRPHLHAVADCMPCWNGCGGCAIDADDCPSL